MRRLTRLRGEEVAAVPVMLEVGAHTLRLGLAEPVNA